MLADRPSGDRTDTTDNHMEREPDGDEDEDSDPAEFDIPEQDDGESGIADQDGLDEQVPFRDWQGVGMV